MLMPLGILAAIMTVLTAPGLIAQHFASRRSRQPRQEGL
jgi:hypothetical protein